MKNNLLAYVAVITACFFWGISYLSTKVALTVFTPLTLAFSRFLIASILLFFIFKIKEKEVRLDKKDIPRIASAGIVGIALYFTFENNGIKLTSASLASMIIASIPIFSLIGECLITKAKLTFKKTVSVIISVIGVLLIVTGGTSSNEFSGHFLGYLFMFGAAISWVVFNFITKPLYEKYSGLTISFYQILSGTIVLAPFAIFNFPKEGVLQFTIIGNVLFLALCCSAAGYFLYIYALHRLGVTVTTLFVNFLPVVTIVSSFFLLGEKITLTQLAGGMIVIFSVCLISVKMNVNKGIIE